MLTLCSRIALILLFIAVHTILPAGCQPQSTDDNQADLPGHTPPAEPPAPITEPGEDRIEAEFVRGIYVPAAVIADREQFDDLVRFAVDTGLNTFVIDLKEESGRLTFAAASPIADRIGTIREPLDLGPVITRLLTLDIRPVARIVTFDDPAAAIARPDLAMDAGGDGRWLDPRSREVWEYLGKISREAAALGFVEVVYDRVRFPGGPGSSDRQERVSTVTDFLDYCREILDPLDVTISMTVTGYAAGAPDDLGIGHDLPAIAGNLEVVSPLLLLSSFIPGLYNGTDPAARPEAVVTESLYHAVRHVDAADLRPWLEDTGDAATVQAQLEAAAAAGVGNWVLYHPDGLYSAGVDYEISPTPAPSPPRIGDGPLPPNELGRVMILVYHEIGAEESRWCRSRDNFRRDLETLYEEGYRLISLGDYLDGNIDLPRGYSPVILTFDDSTPGQFSLIESDGIFVPDPDSAVGILAEFSRSHPDFGFAATFYFLPSRTFGRPSLSEYKLRRLVEAGLELGNHTLSHVDLAQVSPNEAARQLALPVRMVQDITGYTMDTLALPYGSRPRTADHLVAGEYDGTAYHNRALLLVGAEPAPSPFAGSLDPTRLPRIQAIDSELDRWLDHFRDNPGDRYVSDGDLTTITFPADLAPRLDKTQAGTRQPAPY